MTIDARAYTWCNLGPLSDEGASIAEDHAQGAGVLMLKGTVNLNGIFRPTSGAVVKLAYSDGQTWIAQFPLRLRVLSCFSDPIRNKTTVSVGCDLAFYENRKEPVTLDTRDENTGVSEAQWRAQTPAISGSWLVGMILCILRIQYTGNIPLTNYYTRQDFDMSGGYVEELGKLCASEGYVCRMNEAGLAEFISKDQPTASSILLTQDDLIDLNPVNSGELPGDAVYAKYNSISLKAPDSNESDEDKQKRDWELETTSGQIETYKHTWTKYEYTPTGVTRQQKDSYGYDRYNDEGGEITGEKYQAKGFEQEQIINTQVTSTTRTTYDKKDRAIRRVTESTGTWGTTKSETYFFYNDGADVEANGASSSGLDNWTAFTCSYSAEGDPLESISARQQAQRNENSDNDDDVKQEITIEWSPLGPIRQQLGVQAPFGVVKNGGYSTSGSFPSTAAGTEYKSLVRRVIYQRDKASGISKTITSTKIPYIQTFDGSESLSRERDKKQPWENQDDWLGLATSLRDGGTEIRIRTEREFGTQRRPSAAERTTESNQKAPNVEQESRLAWAVGSAASQTAVELSPPYAPDDRVVGSGSSFVVIPSDAAQKVLQYARLENRYLFGHRNGVGIQVLPEALPPKPLSVVYIRLKGCTGAFLVNGRTWNLDPSGATVTCDALFWGAIDGTVGNAWFPLPPNISALPTPVAITSNSNPVPANAIPIPTGFNFNNPDLNTLFGALPANTAPIPPATIAPAIIIKPYRETIFCGAGSGSGAIADPQFWIAQPPGEYLAGSGSGVLATAVTGPSTSLGARWTSGTTFTAAAGTAGPGHGGGERWVSGSVFVAGVGSDGIVRAPGARWTSATAFTAGAAEDGLELAPGARWTSGSTFTAGAGSDDLEQAPGATWSSASTFLAGAGDDGIEQGAGANWSSASTFTAGAGNSGLVQGAGANWSSGSAFYAGVGGVGDGSGAGAAWTSGSTFTAGAGAVAEPGDRRFANVKLLLHMDGANGATTFTDNSLDNRSITRYGSAQISTAQSKFGGASALFDGSGDYLEFPGISLSSSADCTIELWFYLIGGQALIGADAGNNQVLAVLNGKLYAFWSSGADLEGGSVSANTWYHAAITRSSGTLRLFLNGTQVATATGNTAAFSIINVAKAVFRSDFNGYIDDVRITVGFARYLSSFTPPATPFPNIASTTVAWTSGSLFSAGVGSSGHDPNFSTVSLLLHFDGANGSTTFTDSSSNNVALTRVGNGTISTAQAKFGQSYLNASAGFGDRLVIPASSLFTFAGDFTVEVWCYQINRIQFDTLLELGTYDNGIMLRNGPSGASIYVNNQNIPYSFGNLNEWIHIAVVRVGTTVTAYANGVSVGTANVAGIVNSNGSLGFIGDSTHAQSRTFLGYIDELRISKVARYTSNFTPPTTPFPNSGPPETDPHFANVSLLLHMDGSEGSTTIVDSSSNNFAITTQQQAQLTTTGPRFGTASLLLDGTQDHILTPANAALQLGTGDFTVECWIYPTSANTDQGIFTFGGTSSGLFMVHDGSTFEVGTAGGGTAAIIGGAPALNTWQHVAITRSGTSLRLFVGGAQVGSTATDSTNYSDNQLKIGYSFTSQFAFAGRIDEFRVTKGVARYTANFTPPTAPFPNS